MTTKGYLEEVMKHYGAYKYAPGVHHEIPELVRRLKLAIKFIESITDSAHQGSYDAEVNGQEIMNLLRELKK